MLSHSSRFRNFHSWNRAQLIEHHKIKEGQLDRNEPFEPIWGTLLSTWPGLVNLINFPCNCHFSPSETSFLALLFFVPSTFIFKIYNNQSHFLHINNEQTEYGESRVGVGGSTTYNSMKKIEHSDMSSQTCIGAARKLQENAERNQSRPMPMKRQTMP